MPLTCVACALKFESTESQRAHYRLDWHRANLKRKVAGLPPISNEEYDRRKAAALEMQNRGQKEEFQGECQACRKKFSSRQIMDDHLRSKKHLQKYKAWEKQKMKQEAAAEMLHPLPPQEDDNDEAIGSNLVQADTPPPPPQPGNEGMVPQCPGQHGMLFGPASEPLGCDECGGCFGEGVPFFSCRECEHDVCGPCGGQPFTQAGENTNKTKKDSESSSDGNTLSDKMAAATIAEPDEILGQPTEKDEDKEMKEPEVKLAPLLVDSCLFCSYGSRKDPEEVGVEACLNHMVKDHGFFIPDVEYLVHIEGLLMYLQEKVKRGMVCLYCHKPCHSLQAVQSHMRSKGHCKLLYDIEVDMEEFEQFYDFSASYKDAPEGLVSTVDDNKSDSDFDSMSDSDDEDIDENTKAVKFGRMFKTNHIGELVLLDGRVVGNRVYKRYYRQHFRPEDDRDSIVAQARENRQRLLLQYGFTSEGSMDASEMPRGVRTAIMRSQSQASKVGQTKELQQRKRFYYDKNKSWMKLGTHNNKLQKFGLRVQDM